MNKGLKKILKYFLNYIVVIVLIIVYIFDLDKLQYFEEMLIIVFIISCYGHLYYYSNKINIKENIKKLKLLIPYYLLYLFLVPILSVITVSKYFIEIRSEYWISIILFSIIALLYVLFDYQYRRIKKQKYG